MLRRSTGMEVALIVFVLAAGLAYGKTEDLKHTLSKVQNETSLILDDVKSPYLVPSDYVVGAGKELVVKPGVTLVFAKNAGLIVQGSLKLEGTAESPIVCQGKTAGIGTWLGIKVCSKAKASIEGVSITGAKVAFRLEEDVTIRKCYICKNKTGIECATSATSIADCYICENRGDAVSVRGSLQIDHCTIADNIGNGIRGKGDWKMEGSIVKNNQNCGIDDCMGSVKVEQSAIFENKKYDAKNGCGLPWSCSHNYWGPAAIKILNKTFCGEAKLPGIYDRHDQRHIGDVFISGWLSEIPAGCGAREYPGMPKK